MTQTSLILFRSAGPLLAVVLLSACATPAVSPEPVVTIDGRFAEAEWSGARDEAMAGGTRLLIRDEADRLLIGVRLPRNALRYVDTYILNGEGRLINFHTSLRRGERALQPGWTDNDPPFVWEPGSGWEGSVAPQTSAPRTAPISERLAPYEGYEMRIPAPLIGPRPWRMRVEVRDFTGARADWVYPSGSMRAESSTWARLS